MTPRRENRVTSRLERPERDNSHAPNRPHPTVFRRFVEPSTGQSVGSFFMPSPNERQPPARKRPPKESVMARLADGLSEGPRRKRLGPPRTSPAGSRPSRTTAPARSRRLQRSAPSSGRSATTPRSSPQRSKNRRPRPARWLARSTRLPPVQDRSPRTSTVSQTRRRRRPPPSRRTSELPTSSPR